LAALILAVAGVAAAVTHEDDDGTPAAVEQPATTTSSSLAVTTTTAAVTSTSATPSPTSTTAARATTTTRRGATTTTARAGATTTTAAGPAAACTTAQMEATVTTDKASYAQGEQVRIQSTLRNRSTTTCTYPSFVFSATILSPGGATITGFNRQGDSPGALGPGQANEASVNWDRISCPSPFCTQSTPGTYAVSVTWNFPGGPYTATRTFELT
jgi:hypothetical protein